MAASSRRARVQINVTTSLLAISILAVSAFLAGCGEGEDLQSTSVAGQLSDTVAPGGLVGGSESPGGSSSTGSSSTPAPASDTIPTSVPVAAPPQFVGYDFELSEGDFWRFRWEYLDRSCAQGSGCKTKKDDGEFQVTLGPSRKWMDATVFEVGYSGNTSYIDDGKRRSFVLNWAYIGVLDNRIVATDGYGDTPLVTLFDGRTGKWAGSGFFTDRFSSSDLFVARSVAFGATNELASWAGLQSGPLHSVTAAASQGKCETIEGRQICPREESFSYNESEYYRPGVGPVAYLYSSTASFSGGGFSSSYQTEERVSLTASSLTGDERVAIATATPESQVQLPTPTSTPVALPTPIFGPVDGEMELSPNDGNISDFSSGLSVGSGIVQVAFSNPSVPDNKWSHGITFRQSEEETFHAVFINGDGIWGHFVRGGSSGSEHILDVGRFDFATSSGSTNVLTLIFGDVTGGLFINGQQVANLDLSFAAARVPGDVRVMTGLFPTDELSGATTAFAGFSVYELE